MPSFLKLTNYEARDYLLEENNYVNFDLPPYITFEQLLQKVSTALGSSQLVSHFEVPVSADGANLRPLNPADYENTNYHLISNKDGEFAWRPFEIIHPVLYVALVNEITSEQGWAEIQQRFQEFGESAVSCESIPYKSDDEEKHKAHQINRWWTNVEQASLRLSLQFQYVFDVDIADCYGSIYTHSISWAIHGKELMKQKRNDFNYLGNRIDNLIQKMRHRQTNGIPQGSTIMDFVSEIVLGYIDLQLTEKLDKLGIERSEYAIIRYRDDYKIFTNNPVAGKLIVKTLSEVLSRMGMKLNTNKTKVQADPVIASVKTDKLYELLVPRNRMSMSKWLMQIYANAERYPNSGLVTRQLNNYYKAIEKMKSPGKFDDPHVMIGIITNTALKNPKTYPYCMAILSKLIDFCDPATKVEIVGKIREKFKTLPNTGLLDIWLQRVSYKLDPSILYEESLARIVSGDYVTNVIWASPWLKQNLRDIVSNTSIIDRAKLGTIEPVIRPEEVILFNYVY